MKEEEGEWISSCWEEKEMKWTGRHPRLTLALTLVVVSCRFHSRLLRLVVMRDRKEGTGVSRRSGVEILCFRIIHGFLIMRCLVIIFRAFGKKGDRGLTGI